MASPIRSTHTKLSFIALGLAISGEIHAETSPPESTLDTVQVTATRFGEQVQELPNSVEVISGDTLRARSVNDLRTALALVGGVSVASGGDDGPAGAVPGLLGLREIDDFLLVVDGVPAGGAFLPQFSTLDLHDVERIEIQRGTAPVFYGTTAFAGTINIVHYAAGSAERIATAAYGSFGSLGVSGSAVISDGTIKQSVSADGGRDRYRDAVQGVDHGHLLYRLGTDIAGGAFRTDFDVTIQHQRPGSPRPLEGNSLSPDVPADSNQNPSDAKIDTNRFKLATSFDKTVSLGTWGTSLSWTQTHLQQVRGFLVDPTASDSTDAASLPFDTASPPNGSGFHQQRDLSDAFFDTHLTHRFGKSVFLTIGANELFGLAHQSSTVFTYQIPTDGSRPGASSDGSIESASTFSDQRSFAGIYTQARWNITPQLGVLAGLRLNHTDERRTSSDPDDTLEQHGSSTRLNGSLGINWRLWQDADADFDDVVAYAGYGNTFQPPQIDFGPEDQGAPLLRPETERSFEAGVKADGFDGRLSIDLSGFYVDFGNQAVAIDLNGTPSLASGGKQRFQGAELEVSYKLTPKLTVSTNYSYNDARYRNFQTQIDGSEVQLEGRRLVLSPRGLAAIGLIYGAAIGPKASLTGNFVGDRYLDSQNTIRAQAYATLDGAIGWQFRRFALSLDGYNLSNRRDPVLQSELGDSQFYILQSRRLFLRISTSI